MSNPSTTAFNELLPCPSCGSKDIKLQTPVEDDNRVRRAYVMCFECFMRCPDLPTWTDCASSEVGSRPFAPFRDHWNAWVRKAKGHNLC